MEWEFESESVCEEDLDEQMDLRQSSSSALTRVAKRVGAWSEDDRSYNFLDSTGSPALPANWTTPILLNGLVPGSGSSQRIGREVLIHSIRLFFDNGNATKCRFVLLFDHQSNGATPAVTDVFQTDTYLSCPNFSYRDRFEFLLDVILPTNGQESHLEETLETQLTTFYNSGVSGTVADIASGALYLMMNDSASTFPNPVYSIRIEYEE